MPHAYGYRAGTRKKFAKGHRQHGAIKISKILTNYHIGDYVDILVDGAIHKGMPHHSYQGKTGRVFNVNERAIGVIVNKVVRNRIQPKRIHVRVEHIRQSTSRLSFLERITKNDKLKATHNLKIKEALKAGKEAPKPLSTKRLPAQPREAHVVKPAKIVYAHPLAFKETW